MDLEEAMNAINEQWQKAGANAMTPIEVVEAARESVIEEAGAKDSDQPNRSSMASKC